MKKHLGLRLLAIFTLSSAMFTAACSSDDTGSTGTGGGNQAGTGGDEQAGTGGQDAVDDQIPADNSEASIAAFLATGSYKTWTGDAAPRGSEPGNANVHGEFLQVYFNDSAVASYGGEATPGSMAVKEIYDAASTLVGKAISLRNDDGTWTYYCDSTDVNLCTNSTSDESPLYNDSSCGFCHSDTIYAPLP